MTVTRSGRALSESAKATTAPPPPPAESPPASPKLDLPCVGMCKKCHNDKLLLQEIADIRESLQALRLNMSANSSFRSVISEPTESGMEDVNGVVQNLQRQVNDLLVNRRPAFDNAVASPSSPAPASTPIKSAVEEAAFEEVKKKKKKKRTTKKKTTQNQSAADISVPRGPAQPKPAATVPPAGTISQRTIFVYGLEPSETHQKETTEDLLSSVQRCFRDVLPPDTSVSVTRLIRLKATHPEAGGPGPVKVTLSMAERDQILRCRRMVPSTSWAKVPFFCREYSLEERIKHRQLVDELRRRVKAGESNFGIRSGRVMKNPRTGFLRSPVTITGWAARC